MFTAEEAKLLSDKSNTFSERLKYVFSAIKSAAKIGDYSVGLSELGSDVQEKLIELGFNVADLSVWNTDVVYYTVSWDKEEE